MNQKDEIIRGKQAIQNVPGKYISHTLQLTLTGDEQDVDEVVYGEVTNFANLYDLGIVQISAINYTLPHIKVTVIFKKESSYK